MDEHTLSDQPENKSQIPMPAEASTQVMSSVVVPPPTAQPRSMRKLVGIVSGAILGVGLLIFLGISFIPFAKWSTPLSKESTSTNISTKNTMKSLLVNNKTYIKGFTLPVSQGADYASESYEWVTDGETVEKWSTLVTTHKLSPLDQTKPLSAQVYAQNAASLNQKNGATILETSVINTPDAIKEAGVDPANPPYLLVYVFPTNTTDPLEVNFQKIVGGPNGSVNVLIYAFKLDLKTNEEIDTYFKSDAFYAIRTEVIKANLSY